ncbi:MAG: AraC family transcriptional regulator [Victivallaceae bacterium]|jgi:AraC-like DNA-binding protein
MNIDRNLYFSTRGSFTIHAPQPVDCPLGQIIFAGTKWNSQATYGHAPPPDYLRPTPHYLLVYTLEGEADYFDDTGVRTILRKGMLVWTRPNVNQSYGPRPGSRWSEFFMWFGGPVFDTWQAQGFPGSKSRVLFIEPVKYWIERFIEVVQPPAAAPAETSFVRLCRLQQILAEAMQIQENNKENTELIAWRKTACRLLSEGTLTSPALAEVAKCLNMSYSLFRQRFLLVTGKTPGKFRSGEIMRKASSRLLESNDSLSRIAEHFGFHDQFHFSRRFKHEIGMSPSAFRHQLQSK